MSIVITQLESALIDPHLGRLGQISERAYAAPPWNLRMDFSELLAVLRRFEAVWFFLARTDGEKEIKGFSVGVRLDTAALDFFRVPRCCLVEAGDYHLSWRAVDPAYQGMGLGTALVLCRLEHASNLGCRRITGDTHSDNLPTLQLYESLGFEICHRRRCASKMSPYFKLFIVKTLNPTGSQYAG